MEAKMSMIKKNQTWILVDNHHKKKVIEIKWMYRIKLNSNGLINKFKAKLIVKGFSQVYGVDFFETFAPIAWHDMIRLLLAFVVEEDWEIWHLDIKSAFLNGTINEDIYVEQPKGIIEPGKENKVCKLIKTLYRLKQALKVWHERMDSYL